MNVASYHELDPKTGFLQTTGNYVTAFTPERKTQFLEAYKANGLRFKHTCKQLAISEHTIHHHAEIDPEFKTAIAEAQSEYAEELEARQRNYALEPKHFMDRAMQLRALLPEKYAREQNQESSGVTINVTGNVLIESKRRAEVIDTEIVKEMEQARNNTSEPGVI